MQVCDDLTSRVWQPDQHLRAESDVVAGDAEPAWRLVPGCRQTERANQRVLELEEGLQALRSAPQPGVDEAVAGVCVEREAKHCLPLRGGSHRFEHDLVGLWALKQRALARVAGDTALAADRRRLRNHDVAGQPGKLQVGS